MPRTFSWLHLSDLKLDLRRDRSESNHLLQELSSSVREQHEHYDALFFTGDVVREADPDPVATDLLISFWRSLPTATRYFVPGNHDCQPIRSAAAIALRYYADDQDLRETFWDDSGMLDAVRSAFAPYVNWSRASSAFVTEGILPGDFLGQQLVADDLSVGIVGLNMVFGSITGARESVLDPRQLHELIDKPDEWAAGLDLSVLLTHNPPSALHTNLSRAFTSEIATPGRFSIHLCGNYHGGELFRQDSQGLVIQGLPINTNNRKVRTGYLSGLYDADESTVRLREHILNWTGRSFAELEPIERVIELPRRRVRRPRPVGAPPLPPVRIESLELQHFRCFDRLSLTLATQPSDLPGVWTCLAGINGAGKSAILQAISLVLLGDPQVVQLGLTRLERMRQIEGDEQFDARVAVKLIDDTNAFVCLLELTIGPGGRVTARGAWDEFNKVLGSGVFVGYGATRNLSSDPPSTTESQSVEVRRQRTLFEPLAQLPATDLLLAKHELGSMILPLFERMMDQVFEGEIVMTVVNGLPKFSRPGRTGVQAIDLPDGYRSSVAWLADLCCAWCEKNIERAERATPQDVEGIVLIDEIDLHLHPQLQRSLVTRLRSVLPRVQWIVSTHSPLVLANFQSTEIIALDRDAPDGIRPLDREIVGFTSDQIYEWLMGTRPTGTAVQQLVTQAEAKESAEERLAEVLRMSADPEGSAQQAKRKVAELKGLLSDLEP